MSMLDLSRCPVWLALLGASLSCSPPRSPADDSTSSDGDQHATEVTEIVVQPPPQLQVAAPLDESGDDGDELPMAAGQKWKGSYLCGQGKTHLELEIVGVQDGTVDAIFRFHHRPSGARGAYHMSGSLQPKGHLSLSAGEWIERPPGYITVNMTGAIKKRRYAGRIDNDSCGAFSVMRQRGK